MCTKFGESRYSHIDLSRRKILRCGRNYIYRRRHGVSMSFLDRNLYTKQRNDITTLETKQTSVAIATLSDCAL